MKPQDEIGRKQSTDYDDTGLLNNAWQNISPRFFLF